VETTTIEIALVGDAIPGRQPLPDALTRHCASSPQTNDTGREERKFHCGLHKAIQGARRAAIRRGWHALTKERAYAGPGVHYEQPAIRGQPPRGSYRLPRDLIAHLGKGDVKAGAAVAAGMFSVEPGDDPTIIHPDVVRDLGHGSVAAGRRVLERFVAMLRRQGAQSDVIPNLTATTGAL
jgi:hypothetical protein